MEERRSVSEEVEERERERERDGHRLMEENAPDKTRPIIDASQTALCDGRHDASTASANLSSVYGCGHLCIYFYPTRPSESHQRDWDVQSG